MFQVRVDQNVIETLLMRRLLQVDDAGDPEAIARAILMGTGFSVSDAIAISVSLDHCRGTTNSQRERAGSTVAQSSTNNGRQRCIGELVAAE